MSKRKTIKEYVDEEIQGINAGGATINDSTESAETVYSSEKVVQLISAIELLPGPEGPQGIQGIQGNPGSDANVTKENVEAVLTGEILTHTHPSSGGLTQPQIMARSLGC